MSLPLDRLVIKFELTWIFFFYNYLQQDRSTMKRLWCWWTGTALTLVFSSGPLFYVLPLGEESQSILISCNHAFPHSWFKAQQLHNSLGKHKCMLRFVLSYLFCCHSSGFSVTKGGILVVNIHIYGFVHSWMWGEQWSECVSWSPLIPGS